MGRVARRGRSVPYLAKRRIKSISAATYGWQKRGSDFNEVSLTTPYSTGTQTGLRGSAYNTTYSTGIGSILWNP